ncbi:MAG: DUF3124 domain-containing protein [Isosphaeraceae bacterium]
MNLTHVLLAAVALGPCVSCGQDDGTGLADVNDGPRIGVKVVPSGLASFQPVAGQTIYVPAYSSIYSSSNTRPFALAVTLSVRNTDQAQPIWLSSVQYYNWDGTLVRDYLKEPLRIAPMASTEFFVKENDATGGMSASFLVDWVADQAVSNPVVETIMIGTARTQGISFVGASRVLKDRAHEQSKHDP